MSGFPHHFHFLSFVVIFSTTSLTSSVSSRVARFPFSFPSVPSHTRRKRDVMEKMGECSVRNGLASSIPLPFRPLATLAPAPRHERGE